MGDSLARVRKAPASTRSDVGYELDRVQRGKNPSDFKPMPDIGSGVVEIRVHDDNGFACSTLRVLTKPYTCFTASSRNLVPRRSLTLTLAGSAIPTCLNGGKDEYESDQRRVGNQRQRECLR
jgi:putative component of toxin-antitoxin plasmid stabilization module